MLVISIRTRDNYDIRTVQQLLGHKDVSTTMIIYTHGLNRGGRGVRSPLDRPSLRRSGYAGVIIRVRDDELVLRQDLGDPMAPQDTP